MPARLAVTVAAVAVALVCAVSVMAARPAYASSAAHPAIVLAPPSPTPSPSASSVPTAVPSGSSSASPAPGPPSSTSTQPAPPPAQDSGGCGWFDVTCKVKQAFNSVFRGLVTSALNPVFRLLGQTLLASPRVDQMERTQGLWATSAWIANTCFVLFVLAGGVLLMGHGTVQSSYTAKDVAPRLVIGMVAANTSLLFIGQAIDLANALAAALMGQGVDPDKAAGTLQSLVVRSIGSATDPFMPLLAAVAVVLALIVIIIYLVRVMLLILLTAAAPLALACHALPQTDGLARLWWRSLIGVLAIQVAQSLVLITALQVFFSSNQAAVFGLGTPSGMLDLLLVICLLYILMRIPSWISRLVWQGGLGTSPILRAAKTAAAIVVFRRLLPAAAQARGRSPQPPPATKPPPARPPGPSALPRPQRWRQPELPLRWPTASGSPRGVQTELPLGLPDAPPVRQPTWTQLRLPAGRGGPTWRQERLPIPIRYQQTRLPMPPGPAAVQPELPLAFPQRGSPQAGRSPRRVAEAEAFRDAAARARARAARRQQGL